MSQNYPGSCFCGAVEITVSGTPVAAGKNVPKEMGGSGVTLPE